MRVHRIRLSNYRGIDDAEVEPRLEGVTVVQGPNEIGKSSLIEAFDLIFRRKDRSSAQRVEAIQPKGRDVGPEAEVEVSTGSYRFIYRKRWLKNKETTLNILEPEKEKLTGDKAHERANEILAETLDVDLWEALRVAQGTGISLPNLDDKAALSKALDEAAGSAMVGEEEVTLYREVKERHNTYWRKNGEPRKLIEEQRDRVEKLDAEVKDLEDQYLDLQHDIERIEQIQGELDVLRSEEEKLADRRDDWKQKLKEVEQLERTVEDAKGRFELAQEQLERTKGRLDRRENLIEELEKAQQTLKETEEDIDAYRPDLEEARSELGSAREKLELAKEEHREAVNLERLRRRDLEHQTREKKLGDFLAKVDQVAGAKEELETARKVLAEIAVEDALVDEIRDMTYTVMNKRERLEEGGPSVRIEAHRDLSVTIDGHGGELAEGESFETGVSDEATIDVPEIVSLTVEAGTSTSELRDDLESAEQQLSETLNDAAVDDLEDAIDQLRERNQAMNDKERAKERITQVLGDRSLDELEDEIASLRAESKRHLKERPEEPALPPDHQSAKRAHRDAEATLDTAKEALDAAEARKESALELRDDRQKEYYEFETDLKIAEKRVEHLEEDIEEAREKDSDQNLSDEIEAKQTAARKAEATYQESLKDLEDADPASVETKAENAKKSHQRAREEIAELEQELTKRRAGVEARGGDGIYEQLELKRLVLDNTTRELSSTKRQANSARLLFEVLDEERSRARKTYIQPLKEKLDRLGQIVYGSSFEVHIDENLTVLARTLDSTRLSFDDLSGGAKEQLSILLRLACAKIVAEEGDGVPLLLDDALGYSDPDNLEAMGAVLSSVADSYQLLVLTCVPDRYRHVGDAKIERIG